MKRMKRWLAMLLVVLLTVPPQSAIAANSLPSGVQVKEAHKATSSDALPEKAKKEAYKATSSDALPEKAKKEARKATSSDALPEEPEEEVIFNTGNCEVSVVGYEDFWDNELGDAYFEEDGNYTINIPEDNPFFPYEVQFTCGGDVTNEWFMTPDDSVEVDGHTFSVSAYFDGSAVTQMSLEIAGDTVIVYPEKKKFKDGDGAMVNSLLPLKERELEVDLSDYTPAELTMVSIDAIFTGDQELKDTDKVIWTHEWGNNYAISSSGDRVNLSYETNYGNTTWEMIVGEADQLAGENIRYFVTLNVEASEQWLIPTVYKQDSEGKRVNVKVSDISYRDDYRDDYYGNDNDSRYLDFEVPYDETGYGGQTYLGLQVNPDIFASPKYDSLKAYKGEFRTAAEAADGIEITDQIFCEDMTVTDAGYVKKDEDDEDYDYEVDPWITIVTFDSEGNETGCLPIYWEANQGSDPSERYFSVSLSEKSEGGGYGFGYSRGNSFIDGCHNVTMTLHNGYPANGTYYLRMQYYRGDEEKTSEITATYVGRHTSISEAAKASAEEIKDVLFKHMGEIGYAADYSKGVYFTVFVGEDGAEDQEIYYYCVKTEEGTIPLSGDTLVRFDGLADGEGNPVRAYIVDNQEDSYAEYNYLTILVGEDVDLTSLAPVFTTYRNLHLYTEGSRSPEVSGKSIHDFSDGSVQYSVSAENGEDSKNYWLQVVKAAGGKGRLYVNSLADEEAETKVEDGVTYSTRGVFMDGLHDHIHDILLVNLGKNEIAALSAELESDEVELDDYWTLKGVHELPGFDTADSYDDLSNLAKLRIKIKDGVKDGTDVSGTLTVKSGSTVILVLTLTGTVGDPSIITEDIPQAVKYVPYGTMIQNSNKYSWNKVSYKMWGKLPAGMELKPNGELYGVPTETGKFTFTVQLQNSENSFSSSKKTFTLVVNENTDTNVESATDQGYNLTQRVQDIALNSSESQTMVSQGIYAEFKDIFLDGVKLQKDVDYTSESGSTRITIRGQTLKGSGKSGTHTLGIEFRTKGTNDLKRAAQNYKVAGSGQGGSGQGGSGQGSSNSGGGSGSGKPALTRDAKKGFMNSQAGIITGEGANYSHWQQDEHGWKLVYADGTAASGYMAELQDKAAVEQVVWEQVNGSSYAFGSDGYVKNGWIYDYQLMNWYCMSAETGMKTGWYVDPQDGCFYFLDLATGQIATGWRQISGKWYYFNEVSTAPTWVFDENTRLWFYNVGSRNKPLGSLFHDEKTPDGYFVSGDGSWDGKEK